MSWPSGYCESCEKRFDYKHSYGYEKPYGLEEIKGKMICHNCKNNQKYNTIYNTTSNVGYDIGDYIFYVVKEDDIITNQYFVSKNLSVTHPFVDCYGSLIFYHSKKINGEYIKIEDEEIDIYTFNDFENCVCYHDSVDGMIWRMKDKYPVPRKLYLDWMNACICSGDESKIKILREKIQKKNFVNKCVIKNNNCSEFKGENLLYYLEVEINLDEKLIKYLFDNSKMTYPVEEFSNLTLQENSLDIYGIRNIFKNNVDF